MPDLRALGTSRVHRLEATREGDVDELESRADPSVGGTVRTEAPSWIDPRLDTARLADLPGETPAALAMMRGAS